MPVEEWPYNGRTQDEGLPVATPNRRRSERIEVRTTPATRALIDRAVASAGTDLTEFVTSNLVVAAQRVLGGRTQFVLSPDEADTWDEMNELPARDLPGLRALMDRPSPFAAE